MKDIWMIPGIFLPLIIIGWRMWVMEDRVTALERERERLRTSFESGWQSLQDEALK